MHKSRKLVALSITVLVLVGLVNLSECQSPFGSTRPSTLFEPTLSFIRQNIRLATGYVALLRSIFVGAYDRPLVTSTDNLGVPRVPPVKITTSDLPRADSRSTVTKYGM